MANVFLARQALASVPAIDPPQFHLVTLYLEDSLPDGVSKSGERPNRSQIANELDGNRGACWLARHEIAQSVLRSLCRFNGSRYELIAWVVMPNHVHAIVSPYFNNSLASIVSGWKRETTWRSNEILGREGRLWAPNHLSRSIDDPDHLQRYIDYVHCNPVKAGLTTTPAGWPHSSAQHRDQPEVSTWTTTNPAPRTAMAS